MKNCMRGVRAAAAAAVVVLTTGAVLAQDCQWDLSNPGIVVSSGSVRNLINFNGALLASGNFNPTGGPSRFARWDGLNWVQYAGGMGNQSNDYVIWDNGGGSALYLVGPFTTVGGSVTATRAARWDGATWSAMGDGFGSTPGTMVVWDDGTGETLFVGGSFTASGTTPISRLAKWTGSQWVQFGGGANNNVDVLAVYQGQLHVFGSFTTIGGQSIARSARWNGSAWESIGQVGVPGDAYGGALVWDGSLYVYGSFTQAGGVTVNGIGRFDGSTWHSVGGGATQANGTAAWIRSATIFDDGSGPALFIGSSAMTSSGFTHAGGVPAQGIAKWNGSSWSAPTATIDNNVFTLLGYNDADGQRVLWAGGQFTSVGGQTADRIARWSCTPPPNCPADWNQDGQVNSQDISAFITAWLLSVQTSTLGADFNGDGLVNSTDISAFITAWLEAVQLGGC